MLDLTVNDNRLLFAGTICEKKGVRQLLQAFAIVRKSYPSLHLDIFGREWFYADGQSYTDELHEELDARIFENVHFEGEVSRDVLDTKYAQARVCVFPSHMETQGLVSLEAMLLEKPVVFSKYGPGPETIEHGVTGLLCDVYDPEDIAKQILWCIENPKKAMQLGVNARQVVLKKYNVQTAVAKNIQFYKSL
jgi:glycosyltransferase involved in cell wall biosynthesis